MKVGYFEYQKWNRNYTDKPLRKSEKCQKCNNELKEVRVSFWWHGPSFNPTPTWWACENGHREWDYSFHHIK